MIKQKKHILFLIGSMTGGGAQRVVSEIVNKLDRNNYYPALALFKKEGPYLSYINKDVPIYEIFGCAGYKNTLRFRKELLYLIKAIGFDLVFSHLCGPNRSILRTAFGSNAFPPIVVCEHNNLSLNIQKIINPIRRILVTQEIKFLYRRASKVVAVSHGVKRDLIEQHGMKENHIDVIYNPVDLQRIQSNLNKESILSKKSNYKKNIVAVGRLIKQKGFSDLIQAFSFVHKAIPTSRLTILGDGELRPDLQNQIQKLGLQDYINLPGFVDNPWTVIQEADLFAMSSYWEGLPLVLLEVMACGIPIIYTDCDYGPREVIENERSGILVPVGDIQAISKAIIRVLSDSNLSYLLSFNALKRVKDFDSKIVVSKYEQLFEDVLSAR